MDPARPADTVTFVLAAREPRSFPLAVTVPEPERHRGRRPVSRAVPFAEPEPEHDGGRRAVPAAVTSPEPERHRGRRPVPPSPSSSLSATANGSPSARRLPPRA
jgi:hypothetical protein